MLQLATRKKVKIKMSVSAPTGFGKTYGALLIAYGITGDWSKIAVIDSENESASLYSDLGPYFTIPMAPPYTVDSFTKAVDACIEGGIEVIIVDSTYHYWHGKGGLLEYNNSLGNNSFANWAKTNPMYAKWLDKILQTPAHFICTSRKKQSYEIVENNGKKTVEKKGMEDQIRDGFSYEMTISFNITTAGHLCEVDKDRTRMFADKPEFIITPETGKMVKNWCDMGIDAEAERKRLQDEKDKEIAAMVKASEKILKTAKTLDQLREKYTALSPEMQLATVAVKDELKVKLTPAVAVQTTGQ